MAGQQAGQSIGANGYSNNKHGGQRSIESNANNANNRNNANANNSNHHQSDSSSSSQHCMVIMNSIRPLERVRH
jgi:hypothetical protein